LNEENVVEMKLTKHEFGSELTEEQAIRMAQGGDAAAFEHLYHLHSRKVYGLCLRMLKSSADAEDLTQQVFLTVFRKIGSFRGQSALSTWIHRVTVNAVFMHMRRKPAVDATSVDELSDADNPVAPTSASGDSPMLCDAERLHVRRAISRLPAGYKRLLLLHDWLGYKHCEIARMVGCSAGNSKSQVHKARRRMQELLDGKRWHTRAESVTR
jgi:RNA polymerase sigma-70 factor, ECF subfamily